MMDDEEFRRKQRRDIRMALLIGVPLFVVSTAVFALLLWIIRMSAIVGAVSAAWW